MAALTCPHCKAYANFECMHAWRDRSGENQKFLGVWSCANCRGPISGDASSLEKSKADPIRWEPRAVGGKEFPDVPAHIGRDADQAHQCYSIGAYRAAVVMARRVTQAVALDHGAPRAGLKKQLQHLRDEQTINPRLHDAATAVRLSGNSGAHPDDEPDLEGLDGEEAASVLEFMDALLEQLYQMPAKVNRIKERRQPPAE